MTAQPSIEINVLVKRLKSADIDEIRKNPSLMIKFYPIRNPECETSIFDEVYCLLNETLLLKTYRSRIFYFLNTLLSSSKVPAFVVAAYAKKLSRLTLKSRPKTLVAILRLIGNLIIRHPILLTLRDRVDDEAKKLQTKSNVCTMRNWLENDPFNYDEVRDLKKTNAMESCLWELMPLRFHKHPRIKDAASYLNDSSMPDMEFDLDDYLR